MPLPYTPRLDDALALILLACFCLSAYVLGRSRKFLALLGKSLILHRERTSLFATSTASDLRYLVLLILQACVVAGICLFAVHIQRQPQLVTHIHPHRLAALYVAICLLTFAVRWVIYSLLAWIYFDKSQSALWFEAYSTLMYFLGLTAFPLALLAIYFGLSLPVILIWAAILVVSAEILTFLKWTKLFCANSYGLLPTVLYFCALEIAPYLVLHEGVRQLNEYLVTKI